MPLEFDTLADREGLSTIRELCTPREVKDAGLISLWGAEFEFRIPDFFIEGLKKWLDTGTIAYSAVDNSYLQLVAEWMKSQRNWEIEKEWIVVTYGMTHSAGTICRAFTEPGDGFIGLTPTYHNTFKPALLNGRVKVDCPLLFEENTYSIDYELLEQLMKKPENKVLVFCNPHNPIAKVWGREDIQKIGKLAFENDIIIYSDEIFADTVYEGVPMYTFDQVCDFDVKCITGTSLGKTFSMTGVPHGNMIIRNKELRDAFLVQRNKDHFGSFNPMVRAAYFSGYSRTGSEWLKEMMKYCWNNYLWLDAYCKEYLPQMKVIQPQGTYILWIDCRELGLENDEAYEKFFEEAGCICDVGETYGCEPGFIRINISVPFEELKKVIQRLHLSIVQ